MRKRSGVLMCIFVLICCSILGCSKQSKIEVIEEIEDEPEYLSFFSLETFEDSDLGKYWSEQFAEEYNQDIYVSYEGAEYYSDEGYSYRELLEKRLESSSPDDLYIISAEDVIDFDRNGYWMDLSDMDFVENLSDAARYQSTYDNKVFSVPLTFTGFGLYWNTTLLQEHGLTVPENQAEFMDVCETLKSEGILPYGANKGYALTVPMMCKGFADLYGSEDVQQKIDELNSGETAVSSYLEDGFQLLSYMIEQGYIDPEQAMNATPRVEDKELFQNGGCAFICVELGQILNSEFTCDFDCTFTGVPVLDTGSIAVYGADSRLCVNPNSKQLDTALKFIEMVGTKEALDQSAELNNKMSSAKDSELSIQGEQQAMFELLQQPGQIPNQDFSLHFNTWENIRDVGREICGGSSVEDACNKIDELQRAELQEYSGSR